MLQRTLAIVLVAHTAACGRVVPAASPLRSVLIETESNDVTGTLSIDDHILCRLPCTARLRAETRAVVDLVTPASERIELPTIPAGGTTDDPVRLVVHPTRGHPDLGRGFVIGGLIVSGFVGFLAAAVSQSVPNSDNAAPGPALGLIAIGLFFAGVGLAIIATSSPAHADAITPKPTAPGAHFTPKGFEVRF